MNRKQRSLVSRSVTGVISTSVSIELNSHTARSELRPSEHFVTAGYIFVNQDVCGRFASEGTFMQVTPHVPNHNGRIGMYGISYPGFYAAAGMIDAHPALKAVSPQAPVGDWYPSVTGTFTTVR